MEKSEQQPNNSENSSSSEELKKEVEELAQEHKSAHGERAHAIEQEILSKEEEIRSVERNQNNSENSSSSEEQEKTEGEKTHTEGEKKEKDQEKKDDKKEKINQGSVPDLNLENQNLFNRMSEGGRRIMHKAYEGLYKIPIANRVLAKFEISRNQNRADIFQERSIKIKNKSDNLDLRIGALDESKNEIEGMIEELKKDKMPGAESLALKLKEIEKQKMDLLNNKDKIQTKFKLIENKTNLHINERDRVADKMINRYEKKMQPMETELKKLQNQKEYVDLLFEANKVKHESSSLKIKKLEERKIKLEKTFKRGIRKHPAVRILEERILNEKKEAQTEREKLEREKAIINTKIIKIETKTNPYKNKYNQYTRIKEGRPITIDLNSELTPEQKKRETEEAEKAKESKESKEEKVEKIDYYITKWNKYLENKHSAQKLELIDSKDFLKLTKLKKSNELNPERFKGLLKSYLNFQKQTKFISHVDSFLKENN